MPYANKEDRRRRDAQRYAEKRDVVCRRVSDHYHKNKDAIRARRLELAPAHRAKNAERERARYRRLREETIAAYGGVCACCGEDEPLFLELDHVNNDGAKQRKKIGRGAKALCVWAKRNGWPDTLQLLCANCNQGKKRNGGTCPHAKDR